MDNVNTDSALPVLNPQGSDKEMLKNLQKDTFDYFIDRTCFRNGLIADKTQPGCPASIAVVGFGLSCYIIGVEQKYISRDEAIEYTLSILEFFYSSKQGTEADATGYKGFYYHFLDMETGRRAWNSEISTIDTAILMAGVLMAAAYFDGDSADETKIRRLAEELYGRVEWTWALTGKSTICHGWKPESGFINFRWDTGYSEAHILYVLALGSPTFSISETGYRDWLATFEWKKIYDIEFLYAGPLFIHQMSQIWLDMRGVCDDFNKKYNIDYFENSRRATYVQREYAIKNPLGFDRYGKYCWGISASDGPGQDTRVINGIQRQFYDYTARGVPFGPDDGTVSPWAIVASLPFAPEIVLDTIRHNIERLHLIKNENQGFHASFNATYPERGHNPYGWISKWQFGLNQGPVVLMIENCHSGLVWEIFKKSPYVVSGMRKAGFTGGWLEK